MEKLELSLEFPVLITSNGTIIAHSSNVFHQWIHGHTLDKFFMSIEGLNFAELIASNVPQDSSSINRTTHKVTTLVIDAILLGPT